MRTSSAVLIWSALAGWGGLSAKAVEAQVRADAGASARARADSVRYPYYGADIRFMGGMIAHHAQALVMAGLAPSREAGDPILRLCERIINAQQDEIRLMQVWLADRGQPVPEPHLTATGVMMHGATSDTLMPGMLTEAQMRDLRQARGREFDRLFLTYMIQHHRGAVSMVENLFASQGAGRDLTVFKLASDISVDQATEIRRMQQMLAGILLPERTQP
ncbi:MAG TPA: DUF305 domain-containing protein [Gemmatimonadales bacterium]|nr:DUF305 domain-containing protein [Gemmatimonadales bacterium]